MAGLSTASEMPPVRIAAGRTNVQGAVSAFDETLRFTDVFDSPGQRWCFLFLLLDDWSRFGVFRPLFGLRAHQRLGALHELSRLIIHGNFYGWLRLTL